MRLASIATISKGVIAPLLITIVSSFSLSAHAIDLTPGKLNSLVQSMQRDLKIEQKNVSQYFEMEQRAQRQQTKVRQIFGSNYGGSWLERDAEGKFKMVIATTNSASAAGARPFEADIRLVKHTLRQLEAAKTQLDQLKNKAPLAKEIHSWYVDLKSNSVVLTTSPGASSLASALVSASGVDPRMVKYVSSPYAPRGTADLVGGQGYFVLPADGINNQVCSVGFSVTQKLSSGFVTAGHCGQTGDGIRSFSDIAMLGKFAGSTYPGSDMAWVRFDTSVLASPEVYTRVPETRSVIGNIEVPVGGAICRSGNRTGYRCGVVIAQNVTVNYAGPRGGGKITGLVYSNACVGVGDSGGAVISPTGEAQGVVSGGRTNPSTGENCSDADPVTYHQPIQPIIKAYDLVLSTKQTCGRMNAGRVLATGGSVKSCNSVYSFDIQGDGNLVLYKKGAPIWWNGLLGSGHTLSMQSDGNLVVYNSSGKDVWSTLTYGNGNDGSSLFVQDDGNVVLYNSQGKTIWHTDTYER